MKYFNFLSKKEFLIQLIFLMIIFVLVACDGIQSNLDSNQDSLTENVSSVDNQDNTQNTDGSYSNTKNGTHNLGNNSNNLQDDAAKVDNNSNLPLQYMTLEDIHYSFKPFGVTTNIDLVVTLPFDESISIGAKNNDKIQLNLKVTSDNENIARVDGTTITSVNPGITTLTVTSIDGNYKPILVQVVVPPKVEVYSKLGSGWWYQQIEKDTNLSDETRNIMLKLYKMILQKPVAPFNDPMANVIPVPGGKLKYDEIRAVYWAVKLDYPELFWLKSVFNPYFEGHDIPNIGIQDVFSSLEDFEIKTKEHKAALEKFINEIKDELKLGSKMLLHKIYTKIVDIPYENGAITNSLISRNWEIHSSYGALHNNKAVCDGLSSTFALVVKKLQKDKQILKNVYVTMVVGKPYSNRNREPTHAWNAVLYNDAWSEIDATNAKTLGISGNFMVSHDNRAFVIAGHYFDTSYKFILDYLPFAKERNEWYDKYRNYQ